MRPLRSRGRPWRLGPARGGLPLALALTLAACGGGETGEPGPEPGTAVDLRGAEVMVLPVQRVTGTDDSGASARTLDAEIEYWTGERAAGLAWTYPPELARVVRRTPQLELNTEALSAASLRGDGDYITDPLLGQLRGLGAVVGRRLALVPYQADLMPPPTGGEERLVRVRLALVDTHGGRILWRGAIDGEPAPAGDGAAMASAGRAIARRLIP